MIVTIDGPAGSGKSTAARMLADRLGFRFLDTGAMYRAVGLACLRAGTPLDDDRAVAETAGRIAIRCDGDRTLLDGEDVSAALRTPEASRAASVVATNPAVRAALVREQRAIGEGPDIVSEGRDQGTIVFPHAECKFFVTADPVERAQRRRLELQASGDDLSLDELVRQIEDRDRRDESRAVAPLKPAADAVCIDTSNVPLEAVVERMEAIVRERMRNRTATADR